MAEEYPYTRSLVDGRWDLTTDNLGPAVILALPNKKFVSRFFETDVTLAFEVRLSAGEVTTLNNTVATTASGFSALPEAQAQKIQEIRDRTAELINMGVEYNSGIYNRTAVERDNMLYVYTRYVIVDPNTGFFPMVLSSSDGMSQSTFADAAAYQTFVDTMTPSFDGWHSTGEAMCTRVLAATTVPEVDAIVDNRQWPWTP